ncbi:MAG TPA: DUF4160 domain-containing protein [Candidatus Baltobacteraceae bacterium]|nr:DUF4160 domain-containing protein [Candidatus Baltobacteraceae bacterium]
MIVPTVISEKGYDVRIFTRDGGKPHVHVAFDGKLIKIFLSPLRHDKSHDRGKPSKSEVAAAKEIVRKHRAACIAKWKQIYG